MPDLTKMYEEIRSARAATAAAAETAARALDKIMLMQPVVDAARELVLATEHAKFAIVGATERMIRAQDKFSQMVDAYNAVTTGKVQ